MFACYVIVAGLLGAPGLSTESISAQTPVHLGVSLRLTHPEELAALQKALQDPSAPEYHRWLSPRGFGERFGQPLEVTEHVAAWLEGAGLEVSVAPNRVFLEARGTAAQVEGLLQVQLAPVEGAPQAVHQLMNRPTLPPELAGVVLDISGLDTRNRFHHHLSVSNNGTSMGPQDLRNFYGLTALHAQGFTGQGQKLVVLSTATPASAAPSPVVINYFYQSVSDARARFQVRALPNPQNDVDTQPGGDVEFELDSEMQSVGSPGADSITLLVAPASQVFSIGVNDIVNNLPDTTAVSISLGNCEHNEQLLVQQTGMDSITAMRNAVIQGVMEGQTWSSASGDNGANDCRTGTGPAVDFPSVIPEMVSAGGSEVRSPAWNQNRALLAWQTEDTWNEGATGGAAGGGISSIFQVPGYQAGLGLAMRSVPDIALISGPPAVAIATSLPPGQLDAVYGTSVASPLSAGFFALIASRRGCRLGDPHAALYALGANQRDGGTAVFHDITAGNLSISGVTGPSAGPGYDSATGWGSLDVSAMAAMWPACPAPDAGVDAGEQYTQCGFIGCDAGCTTLPDGPSTCMALCDPLVAGTCPVGTVCSQRTIYASATMGTCVSGCLSDTDCAAQPGTVCSRCAQSCIPMGRAGAKIGDACANDGQCPSGAKCSTSRTLTGGYCTQSCQTGQATGSACGCPTGSVCGQIGRLVPANMCLAACSTIGQSCGRTGYVCQQQRNGNPACLPNCTITTRNGQTSDSCTAIGSSLACDVTSGLCGGRADGGVVDAGVPDAGVPDAGAPDAGPGAAISLTSARPDLGPPLGCGCGAVELGPWSGVLLAMLARWGRRRRA